MAKKVWMQKKTFKCLTCGIVQEFEAKEIMPHLKKEHGIEKGDAYERTMTLALDGTGFCAMGFDINFKDKVCKLHMYQQSALTKDDDIEEQQLKGWRIIDHP